METPATAPPLMDNMMDIAEKLKCVIKQLKDLNLKTNNEPETLTELAEFLQLQKSENPSTCSASLLSKLVQDSPLGVKDLLKTLLKLSISIEKKDLDQVASRENYGIKGINVFRWECRDLSYFSEELKSRILNGRLARKQLQNELRELTHGQSLEEIKLLIQNKADTPSKALKMEKEKEKETLKKEKETLKKEKETLKKEKEKEKDALKKEKEEMFKLKEQEKLQKEKLKKEKEDLKRKEAKSQLRIQGFFKVLTETNEEKKEIISEQKSDYEATFLPWFTPNYVVVATKLHQVKNFNLTGHVKEIKEYEKKHLTSKGVQFKVLKFYEDVRPPYFGI